MDFTLEPEFDALREKTRDFIAEHILPLEADKANYDAHENIALPILEVARRDGLACAGMGQPV